MASGGLRDGLKLDGEAELFEACDQTIDFDLAGPAIKIGDAKVLVFGAIFEDVIDRREDRCGDGADGFLRPALGLQAEELSSVVAVFRAFGGPGALYEHGLEPGRPLAQARRFALASAFVLTRAQAAPGDEMASGRKAAHVSPDLGQNRRRSHRVDPGD